MNRLTTKEVLSVHGRSLPPDHEGAIDSPVDRPRHPERSFRHPTGGLAHEGRATVDDRGT